MGKLTDGDGNDITEVGLHALAFRSDGFGDSNTLYFTSEFSNEQDGLFGVITTGLVSVIRVSAPDPTANTSVTITAKVAAGPGNPGAPTGTVTFLDGSSRLATAPLVDGSATLDAIFADVGIHTITAQYSGDGVFLPSSERIPLQVTGLATTTILTAPADAAPGSALTLTATVSSAGGIPTGQIVFHDGNTSLGASPLDGSGVAILRINTLAAGTHSLTASYAGDGKFGDSTSATVTITIANADFSFAASPATATVIAGQSTQFMLTVTPAGGFANNVTFSCSPITGITCAFNPATVTPVNGAANTTLTVTTSASVSHFGLVMPNLISLCALLTGLGLVELGSAAWRELSNRSRPTADRHGRSSDCCAGIGDERLWRIRQQRAVKSRHRLNHGLCPVWNSFSHDNRQSHGSVACKVWNNADDRTILVLGLDRRPSPVLALSEVSNRDSRRGVLADVLVEVKSDS